MALDRAYTDLSNKTREDDEKCALVAIIGCRVIQRSTGRREHSRRTP